MYLGRELNLWASKIIIVIAIIVSGPVSATSLTVLLPENYTTSELVNAVRDSMINDKTTMPRLMLSLEVLEDNEFQSQLIGITALANLSHIKVTAHEKRENGAIEATIQIEDDSAINDTLMSLAKLYKERSNYLKIITSLPSHSEYSPDYQSYLLNHMINVLSEVEQSEYLAKNQLLDLAQENRTHHAIKIMGRILEPYRNTYWELLNDGLFFDSNTNIKSFKSDKGLSIVINRGPILFPKLSPFINDKIAVKMIGEENLKSVFQYKNDTDIKKFIGDGLFTNFYIMTQDILNKCTIVFNEFNAGDKGYCDGINLKWALSSSSLSSSYQAKHSRSFYIDGNPNWPYLSVIHQALGKTPRDLYMCFMDDCVLLHKNGYKNQSFFNSIYYWNLGKSKLITNEFSDHAIASANGHYSLRLLP